MTSQIILSVFLFSSLQNIFQFKEILWNDWYYWNVDDIGDTSCWILWFAVTRLKLSKVLLLGLHALSNSKLLIYTFRIGGPKYFITNWVQHIVNNSLAVTCNGLNSVLSYRVVVFVYKFVCLYLMCFSFQMEKIIHMLQDEKNGVPIRTVKSFMSRIPSVFTGLYCSIVRI